MQPLATGRQGARTGAGQGGVEDGEQHLVHEVGPEPRRVLALHPGPAAALEKKPEPMPRGPLQRRRRGAKRAASARHHSRCSWWHKRVSARRPTDPGGPCRSPGWDHNNFPQARV